MQAAYAARSSRAPGLKAELQCSVVKSGVREGRQPWGGVYEQQSQTTGLAELGSQLADTSVLVHFPVLGD